MNRRRLVTSGAVAVVLLLAVLAVVISRQRLRRHRLFRPPATAVRKAPPGIPPVEQWTATFERLEAGPLDDLLDAIAAAHPDLYAKWSLGYLHARARLENNDASGAAEVLAPFLEKGHPLRDLALYHRAEIEEDEDDHEAASATRTELIFATPGAAYREEAIDDETEYLASLDDPSLLIAFAARLAPSAPTSRRRELSARIVESQLRAKNTTAALTRGFELLRGGTMDDAADRVARALDRPELVAGMTPVQWEALGDAMRNHRHFDRAATLLGQALARMPEKRDELLFDIGRSEFGAEKYSAAEQTYLRGAAGAKTPKAKALFLWHAARAAQLRGDDRTAESWMTEAIAVPGRFDATTAALTQRIRTRMKQKRVTEASADLELMRKIAPHDHALAEATLAWAVPAIVYGNTSAALTALGAVPPTLLSPAEREAFAYWRARALEPRDPAAAAAAYRDLSRGETPFATFARRRLAEPPALDALRREYESRPAYRAVLELAPEPFPRFPIVQTDRTSLLLAMGLYDEAADEVPKRWPLHPPASALTQSLALNRGNAARESIYAAEVLMKSVPRDFAPELLPPALRQLLYPRYFYGFIAADAEEFGADPNLVLAIMREESRFNPRAKSEAAARGLLQFIITTAREIGRDAGLVDIEPDDLYDPRIVIRLGAKYIAELSGKFGGNRYKIAAAYNAGPNQTALWERLAAAPGDDAFVTAINFDETEGYVRKVSRSYEQYLSIYGKATPVTSRPSPPQ